MPPLYRHAFSAPDLLRNHPPQFRHPHKSQLFNLAYPDDAAQPSSLEVTRWAATLPATYDFSRPLTTTLRPDFYDYRPLPTTSPALEWHVNFADPRLFCAYGSPLFAQDEIQVAEQPLLACVREALLAQKLPAKTDDHDTGPTPILVRNVERRLTFITHPNPLAPHGIYGNRFQNTPFPTIRKLTTVLSPSTFSNILAIAAPTGSGKYSQAQIAHIFTTAYTGFAAAVYETRLALGADAQTLIHTGFWGCGAFGGNRHLMIALQYLAAQAAGISHLVLHTGTQADLPDAQAGLTFAATITEHLPTASLHDLAATVHAFSPRWGISDGN